MTNEQDLEVSTQDIELIDELLRAEARENFLVFRHYIRLELQDGWFVRDVAYHLQQFWKDLAAGKRPKLAFEAPPQHGKSLEVTDFMAWVAGKNPNLKIIFASYSDDLGTRTNLALQRIFIGDSFKAISPNTIIGKAGWQVNANTIEFAHATGNFHNTTIDGQINGKELHLGVIDDPVKGRAEALSKVNRDRTWNWFADDFLTRFAANAGLLVIMTRWHVDDLLGRLIAKCPDMKVLRYKAVATEDERYRKKGEPLFPELKPLEFLLERRRIMSQTSWESEYQQSPIMVGGGILPVEKLNVVPFFDRSKVTATVRYWDKAGTESEDAAFTAGVRMHRMSDDTYIISHVCRGQWAALQREETIKAWTEIDAAEFDSYEVHVEQEPGSGGKESAERTIRMLAGHAVYADKVTGDKVLRADPFAAQVQGGNVGLVAGEWVTAFLDEAEVFPAGKWKDQIDAAAGAFSRLASSTAYLPYDKWL
jgi:predicted phage terminase large subunit-like protein